MHVRDKDLLSLCHREVTASVHELVLGRLARVKDPQPRVQLDREGRHVATRRGSPRGRAEERDRDVVGHLGVLAVVVVVGTR